MSESQMPTWPTSPTVYEINAWVWLNELSREAGRRVNLATVPQPELERRAGYRFDAIATCSPEDGVEISSRWALTSGLRRFVR